MVLAAQIRDQSREHTLQILPDATKEVGDGLFFDSFYRGPLLPRRASQTRERYLRDNVYYHDYNWMVQGAFSGIMKKIGSTPWEIKGPSNLPAAAEKVLKQAAAIMGFNLGGEQRTDIEYYQELLRQADFGSGWGQFCEQGVDFLRQDRGWIWEAIYPGNPNVKPDGPLMGIAHLDSLKCRPTGDPDFPMLYFDKGGKQHLLHNARVRQLVDMLDGDERRPGYGLSALSRVISIANREVLAGRYVEARLDDKPPPGFMRMQGITPLQRVQAFAEYKKEQNFDERPEWGRIIFFHGVDKDTPVEIESVPFSVAPEQFDFKTYTEIDVHSFALAIGVDVQELWELTTGNLGSEGQSEILHQKSRGKTIGALMTSIERSVNDLLPPDYEFTFKYRDAQEDQQNAQIASTWITAVNSAQSLSADEKRRILANTVEQIQEAITDENGQVRRADDLGVQPQEQVADDTSVLATVGGGHPGLPGDGSTTLLQGLRSDPEGNAGLDANQPDDTRGRRHLGEGVAVTRKDIDDTITAFEADFESVMSAMMGGDIERRRFGVIARAQLSKYGRRAMLDGLSDGGVETNVLEDEDADTFGAWLVEQSAYVTALGGELKAGAGFDTAARVKTWVNKSLLYAYELGKVSADANGLYGFEGEDGEESCDTCQRLKGQVHRLKDVNRRNLNPKLPGFVGECGGYRCQHEWVKTSGRAVGGW